MSKQDENEETGERLHGAVIRLRERKVQAAEAEASPGILLVNGLNVASFLDYVERVEARLSEAQAALTDLADEELARARAALGLLS